MCLVDRSDETGSFGGGDPLEDSVCHFDGAYLEAAGGKDGRRLEADITSADNQCLRALLHQRCDAVGIRQAAQGEDVVQFTADGGRQGTRCCPGCDQKLVEGDGFAAGMHLFCCRVDPRYLCACAAFYAVVGIPFGRPQQQAFRLHLAGHVFLRKRRALIGKAFFPADHQDFGVGIQFAQFGGERDRSLPGADGDCFGGHGMVFPVLPLVSLPGNVYGLQAKNAITECDMNVLSTPGDRR